MGREFFDTKTVAEALEGFRPPRRTGIERVGLTEALGRVPVAPVAATSPLPGFARSTLDGYAVRAADTYGASEGLPTYLEVIGEVRMGAAPDVELRPGTVASMPTGGALPASADAVVMVEYTAEPMPGMVEVTRPVAPGDGVVQADDDIATGAELLPAGRPVRAQDLGILAAAGITELDVHVRPRVTILSTGDEVVVPDTADLAPGQVRDATASALAGLVYEAGGDPVIADIVPDDPAKLDAALQTQKDNGADLIVVSAGSSVGTRDATADAVARLGKPGIWVHGLAVKPGKPTILAECDGTVVVGLPGNPLSALVVFRLMGVPLVWRLAGCEDPPSVPSSHANLTRPVASAAGRLDVVQVRLDGDRAEPLLGASALLSLLTAADGYVLIDEPSTGLPEGASVSVHRYC